jgi:DNA repair exonuclease SbcCD ATPase subunit
LKEQISLIENRYSHLNSNKHLAPSEEDKQNDKLYSYDKYMNSVEENKTLSKEISTHEAKRISLQIEKKNVEENILEKDKTSYQFTLYDAVSKLFHSNGIVFEIIKDFIPFLNEKIQTLLLGVVDFTVYLEEQNDKLEIFLKHQEQNTRLIELCSGSEKMFASMAIRVALTKLGKYTAFKSIYLG